mmetsp:Transcript_5089/g.4877  ORF Transcript_5089/g.4877 Transcript_5089/m.4877 type:complete len:172 (+) Transcript_5089:1177-1692(+)
MGPEDSQAKIPTGVNPSDNFPLRQLKEINLEPRSVINYLNPADVNQKKIMKDLISKAKRTYLTKDSDLVENAALYQKKDFDSCGSKINIDSGNLAEHTPNFQSINFKLNNQLEAKKAEYASGASKALPSATEGKNLPAPIGLVEDTSEEPTMLCGASDFLSKGNLFLQKDE